MRINFGPPPKCGDERIREGFLFIPKIIENELRWLCRARWIQQYYYYDFSSIFPNWWNVRWLDDDEQSSAMEGSQ